MRCRILTVRIRNSVARKTCGLPLHMPRRAVPFTTRRAIARRTSIAPGSCAADWRSSFSHRLFRSSNGSAAEISIGVSTGSPTDNASREHADRDQPPRLAGASAVTPTTSSSPKAEILAGRAADARLRSGEPRAPRVCAQSSLDLPDPHGIAPQSRHGVHFSDPRIRGHFFGGRFPHVGQNGVRVERDADGRMSEKRCTRRPAAKRARRSCGRAMRAIEWRGERLHDRLPIPRCARCMGSSRLDQSSRAVPGAHRVGVAERWKEERMTTARRTLGNGRTSPLIARSGDVRPSRDPR